MSEPALSFAVPSPMAGASRLARSLASRLGRTVRLVSTASYPDLAALLDDEVEALWAPPFVALQLAQAGKAAPVAAAVRGGRLAYPSLVIGRPGLRLGRAPLSLALASPLSAAGDRIARLYLASVGQPLSAQRHVGTHEEVAAVVARGEADIGATFGLVSREGRVTAPHRPDEVDVLALAGVVPSDTIVVRRELAEDLGVSIQWALSDLTPRELSELPGELHVESFAPVDDTHLAPLRQPTRLMQRT